MNTKKILCLLILALMPMCFAFSQKRAQAKADQQTAAFIYEVEQEDIAAGIGDVNLRVYSYSKKPVIAEEQARKNAVHSCIFKGVPANKDVPGSQMRPLMTEGSQAQHSEFFTDFFKDGGEYARFVTKGHGFPSSVKHNKEYRVGVPVTVHYSELRKYLESKGMIRGLSTGF